jgi:hypothetical protein
VISAETPAQAFDLHTKYHQHRQTHPDDDRLLHDGYWRAVASDLASRRIENTVPDEVMNDSAIREAVLSDSQKSVNNEFFTYERSRNFHEVARVIDDIIIERANTVFVSSDLQELVNAAEETMPDEVLFRTDVYTPCGFVVLETPIETTVTALMPIDDLEESMERAKSLGGVFTGERQYDNANIVEKNGVSTLIGTEVWKVHGFSWAIGDSINSDARKEIRSRFGSSNKSLNAYVELALPMQFAESMMYVRVYGELCAISADGLTLTLNNIASSRTSVKLIDRFSTAFGEDGIEGLREQRMKLVEEGDELGVSSFDRIHQMRRFLVALFRLMNEYVDIESEKLQRQTSRRAVRAGRTGDIGNVTVLSLRRALYEDGESGTGRKITLAHMVRGHWRNQWYPSQKMHRAKWINSFRRGGNIGDKVAERPRLIKVDR